MSQLSQTERSGANCIVCSAVWLI